MGKIVLTDAEIREVRTCKRKAGVLKDTDNYFKRATLAILVERSTNFTDYLFTRLADGILHGYKERRFRLRLYGVGSTLCYVNTNAQNEIRITAIECARTFTQNDLDNSNDLERLADGCVREYTNDYE